MHVFFNIAPHALVASLTRMFTFPYFCHVLLYTLPVVSPSSVPCGDDHNLYINTPTPAHWTSLNQCFIASSVPQYEAALAVDSVRLISKALTKMLTREPRVFQSTLRHGKFYNNGTEGIDCDSEPVIPWQHGYEIMKTMREVRRWTFRALRTFLFWELKGYWPLYF